MKRESGNYTDSGQPDENYIYAERKVKRIKGFYTHLSVYVIINGIALVNAYRRSKSSEDFWEPDTFWMLFSWGVGLTAHWISVFSPHFLFSKKWEEERIRKIIDKERKTQNWE